MQKLCTAGLTGDGRTPTADRHTFAPVDLTAPKVAAGKNKLSLPVQYCHFGSIHLTTDVSRGRITGSTDLGLICRHNKFYK